MQKLGRSAENPLWLLSTADRLGGGDIRCPRETFCFEGFTLDLQRGCLRNGAVDVELRPKGLTLLLRLVENAGRLVSKDELISTVWPNVVVADDSLTRCVSDVRQALGDFAHSRCAATRETDADAHADAGRQSDGVKARLAQFRHYASFAMRFRGILRGRNPEKLRPWLPEMLHCWILPLERFARILNRDLDAVRNAITETAINVQLDGQVNRLKTFNV